MKNISQSLSIIGFLIAIGIVTITNLPIIYAVPNCSPCSCSGNSTCSGCQLAYTTLNGNIGGYISVPKGTYYNYCERNPGGSNPCTTQNIVCYQVPQGTFVNIYSDANCTEVAGMAVGPFYVKVLGCEP